MKKRLLLIPSMLLPALTIAPAICSSYSSVIHKKINVANKSIASLSTSDQTNANISYDLVSAKKHGLNCGYKYAKEDYLNWNDIEEGSEKSFNEPRWIEPNKLWINTDGENGYDRFIYQQIRVNVNVPANTSDYNVQFQAEATEWWHWNCHILCSQYHSSVQMFDLGDDVNNHPEKFNNIPYHNADMDSRTFMQHGWSEAGGLSRERSDIFASNLLNWSFNNDTSESKTFSKYIGVSFWVRGVDVNTNGDIWSDLKIGFRSSVDATGEIAASLQKWGDIRVECRLTTKDQTCHLTKYVDGSGTLVIPDYVTFAGKDYYVREIPSDWSDDENDITGLKFKDCTHLKKICDDAFYFTNCLDYYVNHKDELLVFPEGLEEIGNCAFYGTDNGVGKIKGYSFPSTLKKIGKHAFHTSPFISGNGDNGELHFKSIPEGLETNTPFQCCFKHHCKYIYAPTLKMGHQIADIIVKKYFWNFEYNAEYLIPRVEGEDYDVIEQTFGDIVVKCAIHVDEARIVKYVSGSGILKIPDNVFYKGKTFYIKEISPDWSNEENNITGLEVKDCKHLKKICDHAFEGTNCLDYYINHKDDLLVFPEGLEEIGYRAFSRTDCGQNKIRGYSFPSTLYKIGELAFGENTPYIDGDNNNGELRFQSVPEIGQYAFYILGAPSHDCKFIYGKTQEMAEHIVKLIKDNLSDDFSTGSDYLIPKAIDQSA